MGIALCHFLSVTDGKLAVSDPGIVIGEDYGIYRYSAHLNNTKYC